MARRQPEVRALLEELFQRFHRRDLVHPDPLEFLYAYPDVRDREIVAVMAAGLAYGQVKGILRSVERVVAALHPHPAQAVRHGSTRLLNSRLAGFQHRWTRAPELLSLLRALGAAQHSWGMMGDRLAALVQPGATDVQDALSAWVVALRGWGLPPRHSLLPDPARGSASKRLHLLLRWMVRCDRVDPGGWTGLSPSLLLLPVDVHMHRIGLALGFTRRRSADVRTVREITAGFRAIDPADPARFDFALTRLPIHFRLDQASLRRLLRFGFPPPGDGAGKKRTEKHVPRLTHSYPYDNHSLTARE